MESGHTGEQKGEGTDTEELESTTSLLPENFQEIGSVGDLYTLYEGADEASAVHLRIYRKSTHIHGPSLFFPDRSDVMGHIVTADVHLPIEHSDSDDASSYMRFEMAIPTDLTPEEQDSAARTAAEAAIRALLFYQGEAGENSDNTES